MGNLKEYYLSSSENRHQRLADELGISYEELDDLDYEINANLSKDGLIYGYVLQLNQGNDPGILKKIRGLNSDLCITVEPWILERDTCEEYEFSAISENTEFKKNFDREIYNVWRLLDIDIDNGELQFIHYRQIYISIIGAMEVYLSDAFINKVISDNCLLKSFIENHPEFKKQKILISDIFNEFEAIQDRAKSIMLDTIYHKLSNVKNMYQATFGIDFPEISEMQKYISWRHDLVHRNGKTKEGEYIDLNKEVIDELIRVTTTLIEGVSRNLEYDDIPF